MAILIFSGLTQPGDGLAELPKGWDDYRCRCKSFDDVKVAMAALLPESDWLQVVDLETCTLVTAYRKEHPVCPQCKGTGYFTKWLNGVSGGIMKPVQQKFKCGACEGACRNETLPKIWDPI